MKQASEPTVLVEPGEPNHPPNRIQVVFHHPSARRTETESLAESVKKTANEPLQSTLAELERMIGLKEAKKVMYEIYALVRMNRERAKHGLKSEQQVYHMVFKGNPGTGKTTVARIVGRIFKEMGILSKGHMIEVERADLVGEFIGHTAQKTRELLKKANGGVLFVDEAYSLARGGEKDFGKEAIDVLVKAMEDNKYDFICILAGYTNEMDAFLEINPGLPSRFPIQILFQDYTVEELLQIADQMVADKDYVLSSGARDRLDRHLTKLKNELSPFETFSNARYVRNAIEQAIRVQAVRLLKNDSPTVEDLKTLKAEDFSFLNLSPT